MSKHLKNVSVVSGLTMVSRILGLLREILTARVFGTSGLISAFFTGLTLPNIFRRLLAEGALTAAFVPALNDEIQARQRAGAFTLVNQVTSWLLLVSAGLVLVAMAVLSQETLVFAVGRGFDADPATVDRWLLAARFAVILFPYLVLVSLAASFSAALQTLQRFVEPALSPVWLNLTIIAALVMAMKAGRGEGSLQVGLLCAGWMGGGLLQMVVPAAALMREGWRPAFDFRISPPLRGMLRMMGPTVFGSSIYLVNMSVSRFVGLSLNDDAVAVLNYAQRLMELPIGVFAVGVATVVFPLISRYAAAGDHANLARTYRRGMALILLINVPAAAGLVVLALPIIQVLLQHGRFTEEATAMMNPVLVVNALGLPFLSFVSLVLRAYYAQKDTATPVRAALLSFAVNLGLSLALMGRYSTVGLAVASNVAVVVQAVYLQWHLARKQDGFAFHHLTADLLKVALASLGMGVVVASGWFARTHLLAPGRWMDAAMLAVLIGLGVAVYTGLAWLLRVEGREDLAGVIAKIRGRPPSQPGAGT